MNLDDGQPAWYGCFVELLKEIVEAGDKPEE